MTAIGALGLVVVILSRGVVGLANTSATRIEGAINSETAERRQQHTELRDDLHGVTAAVSAVDAKMDVFSSSVEWMKGAASGHLKCPDLRCPPAPTCPTCPACPAVVVHQTAAAAPTPTPTPEPAREPPRPSGLQDRRIER